MSRRSFHPAAEVLPLLEGEGFNDLCSDILKHGLQQPIDLLDEKILDGRNRYRACEITGVTPRFVKVYTDDPISYVLSRNLHRRHLDISQRAMVAARAREYYDAEAKKRQETTRIKDGKTPVVEILPPPSESPENAVSGKSRDQAGRAVGVSGKTVDAATKVLQKASPELVKAVEDGKISVSAAAKQVDEPKPQPPAVVVDADGRPIPEHLLATFRVREQFDKFCHTVSSLKGQVKQAIDANPVAWSQFPDNAFRAEMQKVHDHLKLHSPHIVCPYCGGSQSNQCKGCKGAGFLSAAQSRCVPKEMRP